MLNNFGADGTEIAAAASSNPMPAVTLTQMDGTPPFDLGDGAGDDSGSSNGIVRSGDEVTFIVDIDPGTTGIADATVTLPLWRGLALESTPAFCGPGSGLAQAEVMSVLTCTLGDLAPHRQTTRAVTVTASSAPGTVIDTSATLTGTAPIMLVTSNTTRLEFARRPDGCDPGPAEAALDPAIRPTSNPVRATGQISDVVRDETGTPIPGAIVTLSGEDRCGNLVERQISASESGWFAFVGLVAGRYRVTASNPAPDSVPPLRSTSVAVALSDANMMASALDLRLPADDGSTGDTFR
ncbi:carboxypeptidase-like regulatory domain-containing protein [Rhodococcus sp. ACT016]|uniref:carboxypeptidase-like regulatory domain-containing protein n=1 Tax=Rhodococcus sp. ACT016 TaxID=3134808 RepID=UPI003D273153